MAEFRKVLESPDPLEVLNERMEAGLIPFSSISCGRWPNLDERAIRKGDLLLVSVSYPDDRLGPLREGQTEEDLPFYGDLHPEVWPRWSIESYEPPKERIETFEMRAGGFGPMRLSIPTNLKVIGQMPNQVAKGLDEHFSRPASYGQPKFDVALLSHFEDDWTPDPNSNLTTVESCFDEMLARYTVALHDAAKQNAQRAVDV